MRVGLVLLAIVLMFVLYLCFHTNSEASWVPKAGNRVSHSSAKVDFGTDVKPILEKNCKPCHFSGGTMYASLPFDHPETIRKLGTKLFTRIKDENDRRPIRDFLNQQ
jgi:hypothetical protein